MSQLDWDRLLGETQAPAPGWFGKLAALGDFAHRRLPTAVVEALDDWLSKGMQASREQLGEAWLNTYLTGPVWRFAIAPGVIEGLPGEAWWFGVLMPSVDSVGRYFPLVVAQSMGGAPETLEACQALERWYEHIGRAVLGTLQSGASVEAFDEHLLQAPDLSRGVPQVQPQVQSLPGRERYTLAGAASLAQWMGGLALRDALQRCSGRSLWWPDLAEPFESSLSVVPGLPPPESFALLLQAQW